MTGKTCGSVKIINPKPYDLPCIPRSESQIPMKTQYMRSIGNVLDPKNNNSFEESIGPGLSLPLPPAPIGDQEGGRERRKVTTVSRSGALAAKSDDSLTF